MSAEISTSSAAATTGEVGSSPSDCVGDLAGQVRGCRGGGEVGDGGGSVPYWLI